MPNEEVEAFELVAASEDEPVHWIPTPSNEALACDASTDNIDFDDAQAVSVQGLLDLYQKHKSGEGDVALCDDCGDEIDDML